MSIVKSFSVGDGDMFYIKHGTDNFSIIDCCMEEAYREEIVSELKRQSADKSIIRFISTHPDDDHIHGLEYLDDKMQLKNFYCVQNEATKKDYTDDFDRYCSLRDSDKAFYLYAGCTRKWMNKSDKGEHGSSGIHILWPERTNEYYKAALVAAKNGEDPNDISPIIKYSLHDGATFLWMGDMESDFMENIEDDLILPVADILFAPHHGRDSGKVPQSLLDQMSPKIIVIGEASSRHLNYYDSYNTITQNSAGDITIEGIDKLVHIYVSNDSYEVDFLDYHRCYDTYGHYIGTLEL